MRIVCCDGTLAKQSDPFYNHSYDIIVTLHTSQTSNSRSPPDTTYLFSAEKAAVTTPIGLATPARLSASVKILI